jgi:aspartyl-tRNA synthetase
MPPAEIRAVLSADEPELVRRYLELHSERMEERLAERVRTLRGIEASMTNAMFARG